MKESNWILRFIFKSWNFLMAMIRILKLGRLMYGYILPVTIVLFVLTLYIVSLKHNKHAHSTFNLMPKTDNGNLNQQNSDMSYERWKRRPGGIVAEGLVPTSGDEAQADTQAGETADKESPVHIVVVEEHHEVIPYWFAAVREGALPAAGNTLIHIDGHSDLAPPVYVPGFPLFRMPTNDRQLAYFVQKNDAFIQAAGMAGLINRVIWVWPDWDAANHDGPYNMGTLSLGWAVVNTSADGAAHERVFCMCQKYGGSVECKYQDIHSRAGWDGVVVPHEDCHIRKILIVEEVSERRAGAMFGEADWVTGAENVILDIDEDFYGCTYAIEPLLKVNITVTMAKELDGIIGVIFCPSTTVGEREADIILVKIVTLIRQQNSCFAGKFRNVSHECSELIMQANPKTYFISLLRNVILTVFHNVKFICDDISNIIIHIGQLVRKLSTLLPSQLKALEYVGFCLSTTPKTFKLFGDSHFGICYGANTPNDTAVTVHSPSKQETRKRSVLLKYILEKIKRLSPRLVTVCRSMRDGYTPRRHFNQIEKDILGSLNTTFSRNIEIHYDKDLLGGRTGWPSRYKT